jgi:uncharacterized protein (TIGR02186 family)
LIRRNIRFALAANLIIPALWLATASALAQEAKVRVTPEVVRMGAFYGGATLRVEGVTGPDEKIVVVVRGPKVTEVFNQAGRVGPIWVNTGKVTISEVPSLLLVFSSEPLSACLTRAAIDQYGLDLPALKTQMRIQCKTQDYGRVAEDYLAYKGMQGSYRLVSGGFRMARPDPGGLSDTSYTLEFVLPKCAAPGQYQISVLECRGGGIVANSDVTLKVVEVGFPALVAFLAMQHSSAYGILAVVVALLAGFGIDFIAARLFKRKMVGH